MLVHNQNGEDPENDSPHDGGDKNVSLVRKDGIKHSKLTIEAAGHLRQDVQVCRHDFSRRLHGAQELERSNGSFRVERPHQELNQSQRTVAVSVNVVVDLEAHKPYLILTRRKS
jgi:hypothetical protein